MSSYAQVAEAVLSNGYISLKNAFNSAFPNVTYNTTYARRLLQMPHVCLTIDFDNGMSECLLVEYLESCN